MTFASLKRAAGHQPMLLSAVSGEGVEAVLRALIAIVEQSRAERPVSVKSESRWEK